MTNKLQGKRLLVLGGSTWKDAILDFARENNIYIIAAAPYRVGIFDIANESFLIDVTDANLMIPFIKEHQIDGVYMGGAEPVIAAACQYLEELNFPCYCNRYQWDSLQNKKHFKELCINHDLPVVPMYNITKDNIKVVASSILYPVITKPTDGCGSSGFSVCYNEQELFDGFEKATLSSASGSAITERYVKNDAVVVFYTFCNGEVIFSGLEDKYPVKIQNGESYVGGFFVYNSRYTDLFRERYEKRIINMFRSLGITQGSAWIEVFRQDDEFFFNEVGFRYGGSVSIYPVDYLFNINQVANDITYSLTGVGRAYGNMPLNHKSHSGKKYYGVYPLYANNGTIARIDGVAQLWNNNNIVFITATKEVGSVIKNTGDFSHNVGLVHFVFNDFFECEQMIHHIHNVLSIKDTNGNEMLLNCFKDISLLLG